MTNKSKAGGLLKLGLAAAGIGLVVNELSKGSTNRSANVGNEIATAINTTDAAELIKLINGSKALQDYFKRLVPVVNVKGESGISGIDGNVLQSFGDSILQNSALQNNNSIDINNTVLENDNYRGQRTFSMTNNQGASNRKIFVRKDRLYTIECAYKSTIPVNQYTIFFQQFDINDTLLGLCFPTQITANPITSNFLPLKVFFGGIDTVDSSKLRENSNYIKLYISTTSGKLTLNSLIVKEVCLGESVPSNLPFLPVGQEVKDPTTGDRGYYDGTVIQWYTMV